MGVIYGGIGPNNGESNGKCKMKRKLGDIGVTWLFPKIRGPRYRHQNTIVLILVHRKSYS